VFAPGRLKPEFLLHAEGEVLRPAGRGDDAIGNCFFEFSFRGSCLLRDREVFFESGRTADRDRTADPDQFAVFDFEDFLIFIIEDFLANLHGLAPWKGG
jgi:hypothetical protein